MARKADRETQPAPPSEQGTGSPEGIGVSSEHDQGEVQEVDSREQDD